MTSSGLYNALDSDEDDALCTLVGGEKVDLGGRWIRAFGMYIVQVPGNLTFCQKDCDKFRQEVVHELGGLAGLASAADDLVPTFAPLLRLLLSYLDGPKLGQPEGKEEVSKAEVLPWAWPWPGGVKSWVLGLDWPHRLVTDVASVMCLGQCQAMTA